MNKGTKQRKRKSDVYLHRHLFVYLSDKLGSSRIRLIIFVSILWEFLVILYYYSFESNYASSLNY